MRMRRKKHLTQRLAACAGLQVFDPEAHQGRWRELLPGAAGVQLEIGCGKGNFLLGLSPQLPDRLLLGLEKVPDAMVTALEKARAAQLPNVRFLDADAIRCMEFFLPGEVERLYLNFSTPWPSRRHEKRRLTHPAFLAVYRQLLPAGGEIWMKTDNVPFFDYSLKTFVAAGFSLHQVTRDLHSAPNDTIITEYESRFMSQGIPICRCVARREADQ